MVASRGLLFGRGPSLEHLFCDELDAGSAVNIMNLVPVFGVLVAVVILGEPAGVAQPLGGLVVIGGVTLGVKGSPGNTEGTEAVTTEARNGQGRALGNAAEKKCVMVVDAGLPAGLAVNAAAVLAVTLGHKIEAIVGPDVADASGGLHIGLVDIPIPILRADADVLGDIRFRAIATDGLLVVGFTDVARTSKTYEDYTEMMAASAAEDLQYLGVALYGDKKPVNKLTGSLPLLR